MVQLDSIGRKRTSRKGESAFDWKEVGALRASFKENETPRRYQMVQEGHFSPKIGNEGIAYGSIMAGDTTVPEEITTSPVAPTLNWVTGDAHASGAIPAGCGTGAAGNQGGASAVVATVYPEGTYLINVVINQEGIASREFIWEVYVNDNPTGYSVHIREGDKAVTGAIAGVIALKAGDVLSVKVKTKALTVAADTLVVHSLVLTGLKVDRFRRARYYTNTS